MIRKIETTAGDQALGLTPAELVGFLAALPLDADVASGIEVRVVAGWRGQIKRISGRFAEAAPTPQEGPR